MRRFRRALLATVVAVGVAGSAYATTLSAETAPSRHADQARAHEVAPNTPRDALLAERSTTTALRRLAFDRSGPRSDAIALSVAVVGGLALLALTGGSRLRQLSPYAHSATSSDGITARGPPLRLA